MSDKDLKVNNQEENLELEELSMDELENVTGGSLSGAHKRKTSSASSSSKSRI